MISAPREFSIPEIVTGDTWDGIPSIVRQIDGANPPSAVSSVRLHMRLSGTLDSAAPAKDLSGSVTVVDAAGWDLRINAVILDVDAGEYYADLEVTDVAGAIRTLVRLVIPVVETSTH